MKYILSSSFWILVSIFLFIGCKKEKKEPIIYSGNGVGNFIVIPNILDSAGMAFFAMKKYYSYNGSVFNFDNSNNTAYNNGVWATYDRYNNAVFLPNYMDSAKVNGVKFTGKFIFYGALVDTSNSYFASPRNYQLYADTNFYFKYVDSFIDNSPLPNYDLGGCSFPDSASINTDLVLSIGNRTNTMQTRVSILNSIYEYQNNLVSKNLSKYDHLAIFKKEQLIDWPFGVGSFYIVVSVLNWSNTSFRGGKIYFVSEHRYTKKIKLYN